MDKNKNAYQYQEAIKDKFYSICNPLYNFGIDFFSYIKIFPDGSYHLATPTQDMEFIKQYCFNVKQQGDITRDIESSVIGKSQYAIYDYESNYSSPVLDWLYSFDMYPVFAIFKNNLEFIECYAFSTHKKYQRLTSFYLNNLNILEHFCDYFNDKAKDIINSSDKKKRGYFNQQFNLQNNEEKFRAQRIIQFLQETYIKQKELSEFIPSQQAMERIAHLALGESVKEISGNLGIPSILIEKSLQTFKNICYPQLNTTGDTFLPSLSSRQKECLFLLTRGKTAKQIGQVLSISHRTVETHIISLKRKMNCTTKNQLVEKVFDSIKFCL